MKATAAATRTGRTGRRRTGTRTVLVTGADGFWGQQVATLLAADPDCGRLLLLADDWVGLRTRKSKVVRMDPRDLEIETLIRRERVHTVYHLDYQESYDRDEEIFDRNVMGTLTVLAACAAAGVKHVVVRSSIGVYGAAHNNPTYLSERRALRGKHYLPYARDLAEMERYIADTRAHHPELCVTIARLAHVVGPHCDSPLMRYLRLRPAPTLMGFEPLFQVLHETDAVTALVHAGRSEVAGPVNITPDGVLPLFKLLRLAKTPMLPIFHPIAYAAVDWARGFAPVRAVTLEANALRYTCMGENRRMKEELGFQPALDVEEAFARAVQELRGRRARGAGTGC